MAKAMRRKFSAEYKLEVLRQADASTKPGEIGLKFNDRGQLIEASRAWSPPESEPHTQ